jgi:hypothetical protein
LANIAGATASASVVPVISQPRTGCSGLTWNGQSWGAGRDFRSAWGMTLGARRASVGYAPAQCHRPCAVPRQRQTAAEPRAGRRTPASLVEVRPRRTAPCWWRAEMIRGRRRWSPTPPPRRPRAEFRKAASGRRTAPNCPGASTNRRVSARTACLRSPRY